MIKSPESRNVRLSGRQKILSKKVKKGVDKGVGICYNNTCRRERGQQTRAKRRAKLENDTETKIEDKKETVRFRMSKTP